MKDAIAFVLGNFTLTFFALGLLASAIALWRGRAKQGRAAIVEALFSYFLLFSIGLPISTISSCMSFLEQ